MESNGPTRIDELLQAYDEKDDAKFKELIRTYLIHAVDNEVNLRDLWFRMTFAENHAFCACYIISGSENSAKDC